MNRNQILTEYDEMRQNISTSKDKYLEANFLQEEMSCIR